jgi:hypothetical protein
VIHTKHNPKDSKVIVKYSTLKNIVTTITMDKNECFEAAVTAMTLPESRYDVTIVCTTDDYQAEFWMTKLKKGDDSDAIVIAVSEDWTNPSGAGNGLGTLYAWQKACKYAKDNLGRDLESQLKDGTISAALYHTAGKGTRLAPLPASENNNKPGVVSSIINFFLGKICLRVLLTLRFFYYFIGFGTLSQPTTTT